MLSVILKMKILNDHKLLLTNTQVWRLCKAFANNSSVNIKPSKTQLHKINNCMTIERILGRLLGPLLKTGLPLIGRNMLNS